MIKKSMTSIRVFDLQRSFLSSTSPRKLATIILMLFASHAHANNSQPSSKPKQQNSKVAICLQKGPKHPISCGRFTGEVAPQTRQGCETAEGVDSKKKGASSTWIENGNCPKGKTLGTCTASKGTISVTYYDNSDVKALTKIDASAAKSMCSSTNGTWVNGG
jgi:hypothetical protein